ncbi:MAG: AsmA-like C-terminal region-containing protein, partial [Flammeovirgaceae bacterium]|nr:AsmA-like C-terminal region-containing protein [Flammeovirgaceae bacterium]MDW8288913.1 AsmA-like C-terminal region-containing protein [Flammeovirgaceae bacterium]
INLKVNEGYFQYPSLPSKIENVFMDMAVRNETGQTEDLLVDIPKFALQIAQNPIDIKANLKALNQYDVSVKAKVDFGMLQKVYPIEDIQLSGLLDVDFASRGTMKALEAKDYQSLQTKGEMRLQGFSFASKDLPQTVKIDQSVMTFNPAEIALNEFTGYLGKSDVQMKGSLQDYMQYLFQNGTIKGKLSFVSQNFDVNEWMTESTTTSSSDTSSIEPIVIPKNIDFVLDARIGKVTYTNMVLSDLVGLLTIRNGSVSMNNLQFNTLGGTVRTAGTYDTQNPQHPTFDMELDVSTMSFQESFKTFNTIQKLAPIAQNITGTYGTKFKMSGLIGKGMTPVLSSLNGAGNIATHSAALVGVSALNQISSLSGLQQLK